MLCHLKRAAAFCLALALFGCTYSVHLVNVSDFDQLPKKGGKIVEARAENFSILGFRGSTAYVNRAHERLLAQCPRGNIQGITTQYLTAHGFLSFKDKIVMRGLCTQSAKVAEEHRPKKRGR